MRARGIRFGLVAVLALTSLAVIRTGAAQAVDPAPPSLPSGFTRQAIPSGLAAYDLVTFAFMPSGDILAVGRCGAIRLVTTTGQTAALRGGPASGVYCAGGDRGMLGFDLAADFDTSREVFASFNYVRDAKVYGRVSRFTLDSATKPTTIGGEVVVLDGLPAFSATGARCDISHTIGTVIAAPDGTLWIGNGDASDYCDVDTSALAAVDRDSPRGKVFHVTQTGAGVPTNPFYDAANPASWRSRVFAMGLRNPFRFALQPSTGLVFIGDVGWTSYEELNVVPGSGASLGWPCYEGPNSYRNTYAGLPQCVAAYSAVTQPLAPAISYPHSGSQAAIVAGAFATGSTYPPDYQGAFFYGDYARGKIWTVRTDASGKVVRGPEANGFGSGIGSPVFFRAGPNGDIHYADIATSTIYRLRYSAGNRPPTAEITSAVTAGPAPLTVSLSGTGSYDLDGEPLTYAWDFGDGSTGTGPAVTHTWNGNGDFTVTLTATDSLGARDSTTRVISVGNTPPELSVTGPAASTFAVGDAVHLDLSATDAEDGPLPDSAISVVTLQRHCPSVDFCHVHPGPIDGERREPGTWDATIPDHGEATTLEATVTATDSRGATSSRTIVFTPRMHTLTSASIPAGVPIAVNDTDSNSHPDLRTVEGSVNTLAAPPRFLDRVFLRWSDSTTDPNKVLTMPAHDVSLTAVYDRLPKVVAGVNWRTTFPGLPVSFSGSGTTDPDGDALRYSWNFGDGSPASTAVSPAHGYAKAGRYTATLTVTDSHDVSASAALAVTVVSQLPGLVAAYSFDQVNGTTVADVSGHGNNGLVAGPVPTAGRYGRALNFDGNQDRVRVPDSPSLDLTTGMTIAAWVRPAAGAHVLRTIAYKQRGRGYSYTAFSDSTTGTPETHIYTGGASGLGAPRPLPVGTWTHVAVSYDNWNQRIFINGVLVASRDRRGAMTTSTEPLTIGGNHVSGQWFVGQLDEVQIFNRALSAAELGAVMAHPLGS